MTKIDAAIAGSNYITVTLDGDTFTLTDTHPNYTKARDALKARDGDLLSTLVDIPKAVEDFSGGAVRVVADEVQYKGKTIHNSLTRRMLEMMREGFDIMPLANFLSNIQKNPSFRAVNELYGFLEKNRLPITDDGHFLAYKRIREDFTDIYSGTFDNHPGQVCSMERNEVDEDKDVTCSTGLHFCSIEYLPQFGTVGAKDKDNVVILKINPADVVAIPSDYNNAKGRTCRYEVVDNWMDWDKFVKENKDMFTSSVVNTYTPPENKNEVTVDDDGSMLMNYRAAARLICGSAKDPVGALRKRIARGSVQTKGNYVVVDGYYTAPVDKSNSVSTDDDDDDDDNDDNDNVKDTRAWQNGRVDGIDAAAEDNENGVIDGPNAHLTDDQVQNPGNYTKGFYEGYSEVLNEFSFMDENDGSDEQSITFSSSINNLPIALVTIATNAKKHSSSAWNDGITNGMITANFDKANGNARRPAKNQYNKPGDSIRDKELYSEAFELAYNRTWDNRKWNWFDGDR